jgi:cold shock CspA family protein
MQGTIQSMRAERGFGFLRDTEGTEVLFHHGVVTPSDRSVTLVVGMAVKFEEEPGPKGPRATKVTIMPVTNR